jgi:hypothetical protein
MSGGDASVSRMLDNYRELIRRFVIGDISTDEFEKGYLARFKDDPNQVIGEGFDIPLHGVRANSSAVAIAAATNTDCGFHERFVGHDDEPASWDYSISLGLTSVT